MDSGKREKVAYLAALVQRGDLTCEEALAVSDETSSCQSRSTVVSAAGRKKGIDVARGGRENKPEVLKKADLVEAYKELPRSNKYFLKKKRLSALLQVNCIWN
jgi:hypothetical protein